MSASVTKGMRHSKSSPCPICHGGENMQRGKGVRCIGFTSTNGEWVHCSREELGVGLNQNNADLYAHLMHGPCKCGTTHNPSRQSNTVVAEYIYEDEKSLPCFRVVRPTWEKRFFQNGADGIGGWHKNKNGTRNVPFRLPELIAADPSAVVWIVEGEKDVLTAVSLGMVATCNSMGAGKWHFTAPEALPVLRGRDVVVIADADDVGRKHAQEIAGSLRGVARSVLVIECPAPFKDLTEWIQGGGTFADVLRLLEGNTVDNQHGSTEGDLPPSSPANETETPVDDGLRRIATVGVETIFAPLPPVPWLVEGLRIGPGRPTLIAGYGYSGKTVAMQSVGLSIAAHRPVWGVFSAKRGRVLHLDWEMGARLAYRRYQRLAAAMGVTPDELGDNLRVATYPTTFLDDDDAEEVLTRACEGFDFVICDSFTAATAKVDENSSEAGRPFYMAGRVSERTGATLEIIHHCRKPQKDQAGGARMAIRGSSAIFGGCDSVFVFAAEKGEDVHVSHERSPTDGMHVADFGLRIEDVEIDGDHRGGLRVVHLDSEQMKKTTPNEDNDIAKHQESVRKYFREHGPIFEGGTTSLRRLVGMNNERFGVAFEPMKHAQEFEVGGTYHKPVITWRGEAKT